MMEKKVGTHCTRNRKGKDAKMVFPLPKTNAQQDENNLFFIDILPEKFINAERQTRSTRQEVSAHELDSNETDTNFPKSPSPKKKKRSGADTHRGDAKMLDCTFPLPLQLLLLKTELQLRSAGRFECTRRLLRLRLLLLRLLLLLPLLRSRLPRRQAIRRLPRRRAGPRRRRRRSPR